LNPVLIEVSVAGGLLIALSGALELGFRIGRRGHGQDPGDASGQVGVIQAAVLGLLGLLLAFSFAAAGGRFLERQDLIVQEANAIGTSYLRAELLADPHRTELRTALKEYTEHRIAAAEMLRQGWVQQILTESERMHERIWRAAREGVIARPEFSVAVLTPVNEVIDLHSVRVFASRKQLPWLVLTLLVMCSLLATGVIGYGCGLEGQRRLPLTLSLTVLIGAALCVTIDLDQPRMGLLRLSDKPLQALKFDPH
jgi:hypothetical protein